MAGRSWTGAVLAGLVIGGILGVADRTLETGPTPTGTGTGTTVTETEVEVETETTVVTPTNGPTVEATSEQFVEETESGTIVRENTATASAGDD
jgi:hypothetical protein